MKLIDIINQDYESSSAVTQQYKTAKSQFRRSMKKLFPSDEIIIKSCPHFEVSGFIKRNNQYVYFSTGDLRGNMGSMLVRTAKHDKDWTGGPNNSVKYTLSFDAELKYKVNNLFN